MRPVVIPSSSDVRLKVHARHAEISIATDNETCPIPRSRIQSPPGFQTLFSGGPAQYIVLRHVTQENDVGVDIEGDEKPLFAGNSFAFGFYSLYLHAMSEQNAYLDTSPLSWTATDAGPRNTGWSVSASYPGCGVRAPGNPGRDPSRGSLPDALCFLDRKLGTPRRRGRCPDGASSARA